MEGAMTALAEAPTRPNIAPVAGKPRVNRPDIQGLRALAVGLVLVYHLRPDRLPGGFVGVDVFFVISGFLIVGMLAEEIRQTGRLRLLNFYARRIRRLLPAATFVLLVVVAGTLVLLPMSRWPAIMREVAASALDVQNWVLAVLSGDYAQATAAASPVQHYWSLSVEEQFYLIIPLILVISVAAARGRHTARSVLCVVALLTAGSLIYSVLVTSSPPAGAYFVTPTRIWELGIGGLTAMVMHQVRLGRVVRMLLGWVGLALVLFSALRLSTSMAFPGWIALLPTVGAAALLVAGTVPDGQRLAMVEVSRPLGWQPLRYLGDISYSLYLWHWPVIVFVLERSGADRLTAVQVLKVFAVSLVLSILSKHAIEDRFRHRHGREGRRRVAYLLGASLVIVTLATAIVPWRMAQARLDAIFAASVSLDDIHPGALAMDPKAPKPAPTGASLVPDPAVADRDMAAVWQDQCANFDLSVVPATSEACLYGNKQAARTMVLVGDSHMTMYSTALINFAERNRDWRVKLLVHDGCPFGDLPPDAEGYPLKGCANMAVDLRAALLAMRPDLVVTTAFTLGAEIENGLRTWRERPLILEGYRKLIGPLADAGIPVVAIRDVPHMTVNTPRCLLQNRARPEACDTTRDLALGREPDPLIEAVSGMPGVRTADLTDWLCTETVCPAVIGNVVVYRDNHLTDTYVRTLTQPLIERIGLR
jgi:peptidoglycan/LPS O-acetylase OafA/YrhL